MPDARRGTIFAGQTGKEFTMRNEGTIDRVLRTGLGVALIAMVFVGPQTPWGWLGLVPLVTGLVGFCPLYRLVGVNTCKL
jgi:Protein of unknown function (DUF2892)